MGPIPIPGIFTCYMPGIGTIIRLDLIIQIPIPYRYQTKINTDTDTGIGIGIIPIPIPGIGGTLETWIVFARFPLDYTIVSLQG